MTSFLIVLGVYLVGWALYLNTPEASREAKKRRVKGKSDFDF